MNQYIVKNLIKHNGKYYSSGSSIGLEDNEAVPLLKINAIAMIKEDGGKIPPSVPEKYQKFAGLTAEKQKEYADSVMDKDTLNNLLPYCKSKSKKYIENLLKENN